MRQGITVLARAKINLTLDILGKRPDGYHEIDSVMQSVSLFDKLYIAPTKGKVSVTTNLGSIENEDNLVFQAVQAYFKEIRTLGGAEVNITKNIPLSAGLGGGSADAAAVLLALNRLNNHCLNKEKLYALALSLGADVPFCLLGGTARARGIGEQLTPLPFVGNYFVVLVKCGNKTSTKEMYRLIDTLPKSQMLNKTPKAIEALQNGNSESLWQNASNTFGLVVETENLKNQIDFFLHNNALCSSLSGSGPTVYGIFNDFANATNTYTTLINDKKEAFLCKTEKTSLVIE